MNTIGGLARSIMIGDGAVAAYLDIAKNKTCGTGLFHYTSIGGYRDKNTRKNNSRMTSYYYIQDKINTTNSKRYFFGDVVSAPNIDGIPIGYSYTTDINTTFFPQGQVSVADFDVFQSLLRDEYLNKDADNNNKTSRMNYVINNTNFKKTYPSNVIPNSHYGEIVDFYEKLKYSNEEDNKKSFLFDNNYGLLDYYKEVRESLKGKASASFYKNGNGPYAVLTDDYGRDMSDWNNRSENIIIDKNIGTRNLRSYNHDSLTNEYYYYQESDNASLGNKSAPDLGSHVMVNTNEKTFTLNESILSGSSRLIQKTNQLFLNGTIKSLINRFHTSDDISRGRNLKTINKTNKTNEIGFENPYCRVWTPHHQYSKLIDRIRPFVGEDGKYMNIETLHSAMGKKLRPNNAPQRLANTTVLQENGYVRVEPLLGNNNKVIKNYMFSIENLAWKDVKGVLSEEQRGENEGRIMWFPPYNLKFTENVNVNWNGNNFIGRGEQIYTYTNTERNGTLSFTILIDHPSLLNEWRGSNSKDYDENLKIKEEEMLRFFAGCALISGATKDTVGVSGNTLSNNSNNPDKNIKPQKVDKKIAYVVFFPNNYSGYDEENIDTKIKELAEYETSSGGTNWNDKYDCDNLYKDQVLSEENKKNLNKFNLNLGDKEDQIKEILLSKIGYSDSNIELKFLDDLVDIDNEKVTYKINNEDSGSTLFGENKIYSNITSIEVFGFASSHGYKKSNEELCSRRYNFMKNLMMNKCNFYKEEKLSSDNSKSEIIEVNDKDVNSFNAKVARAAMVIFNISKNTDLTPVNERTSGSTVSVNGLTDNSNNRKNQNTNNEYFKKQVIEIKDDYSYDNEYKYFSAISEDSFMVKNITNRIRHFNPAFHSITPEGFNARLTFLHQCTRQGPTTSVNGGKVNKNSDNYLKYAGNLSFGRAPYCILRIGDFFHTKILIDSVSIDYDNGDGTQWDLNPEGAGVQPMFANVNINFKFIGGQDLSGPIERLQNAITSNYYANASVYDKNADYGKIRKDLTRL